MTSSEPPAADLSARLRSLPAVDRVLALLPLDVPHGAGVAAARAAIVDARARIAAGHDPPTLDEVIQAARAHLESERAHRLQKVINATGVLIHTNLGRAPLGTRQLDAVSRVASGYSNLEYDIEEGRRGSRYDRAVRLLTLLTGAEAGLVVNNNAAAILLALRGIAHGREVIVSRGELVEIGGEFRIPEIVAAAGVRLTEVGTTNRTHVGDYERAITPDTAAILKVHPSNYRVVGFTASVEARDLGRLARGRGVSFVHDVGSGLLGAAPRPTLVHPRVDEPVVEDALAAGADLVTFSGDKLLGGPQAGLIVGRARLIDRLRREPILRALRVDKMTLATLEATLLSYLEGTPHELPLWALAHGPTEQLEQRATAIAEALSGTPSGVKLEPIATRAVVGGGSLPGAELDSWAVAVDHGQLSADELARALRRNDPPVIARIEGDRLLLDLRAVPESEDAALVDALRRILIG